MIATRRLAAIMAIDVVGYSRLMGEDETGTARAVREHREAGAPLVAERGGRVVKTMGDGLLLEFPSVVAAVEAAVAIQKMMAERNAEVPKAKRIVYRVGVNLGDVLVDGDDILGDGVNIAARLESICEPGGVLISAGAHDHVRDKIDVKFVDLGEKTLKNIARPARVHAWSAGTPALRTRRRRVSRSFVAGIVALAVVAAAGWHLLSEPRPARVVALPAPVVAPPAAPKEAAHLSIVVLPFANLSGDPSQDYFADGVTENLTADLSRISNSFVIARNTAFTYKGKAVDAREIGKELGVRYVLEGSVQRSDDRARVNAQLIDASSGAHLWADRFEEDVPDLFKLQDDVVARLRNTLQFELTKAEGGRGTRSRDPDAMDLVMRADELIQTANGMEALEVAPRARGLYRQALTHDPDDSSALAGVAFTYFMEYSLGAKDSGVDYGAEIIGLADRAISAQRENIRAYEVKAGYLAITGRDAEAIRVADDGLAAVPNSALLHAYRGMAETHSRQFEKGKADIELALRLSPRDPLISWWSNLKADAELGLGHVEAANELSKAAVDGGYRVWNSYLNVAASSGLLGDATAAKSALDEAIKLNPRLSIKFLSEHKPILRPSFDALRQAGLPET